MKEFKNFSGFEEQAGQALEIELLDRPNLLRYEDLAIDGLIDEKLLRDRSSLTARDIKKRSQEMYNEYRSEARLEFLKNRRNPILSNDLLIDIIKKSQTGAPAPLFIKNLKQVIADQLKLEVKDVNFYTAVGTNFDYCGVDGIFEIKQGGKTQYVNIDITLKPEADKQADITAKQNAGGRYLGDVILSMEGRDGYKSERDGDLLQKFSNKIVNNLS